MKLFAKEDIESKYLYIWISASIISALVANALHFISIVINDSQIYEPSNVAIGPLELSLLTGLVEGSCQWVALRGFVRKSQLWIVLTALGSLTSTRISILISALIAYASLGISRDTYAWSSFWVSVSGVLPLILIQWIFLRNRFEKAWLWIVFNLLAKFCIPRLLGLDNFSVSTLGTPIIFGLSPEFSRLDVFRLLLVGIASTITGAITAIPIVCFIRSSRQ